MLRAAAAAALLALVLAAPARAQDEDRSLLMPGVSYARQVEFTPHGPVVVHVLNAPRPGGLYALHPVLSNDVIVGRETVTSMEKRLSATATLAGVDGDLFNLHDGHPAGGLMRNGVLDLPPLGGRSTTGIAADGSLRVDRIRYSGFWRGVGQRRPLNFNQPPGANGVSLYTSSWGGSTPPFGGTVEAVLSPFPPARPNADLSGTVVRLSKSGNTPIPPGGAVLVGRGSGAQTIQAEAPAGTTVTTRLTFTPAWPVVEAIGGGPVLVRGGKAVFRALEQFSTTQLSPRTARSAVGQRGDGRIVLVAADGGRGGYSVGMTNFELALTMVQLGCVTASALDFGGSVGMAFDGRLLNRPSDRGGERAVAEALLVAYYGVYAPPAGESVLSPNADGAGDRQTLSYKLVRPSDVTASLIGPDGVARPIDAGARAPGVYRFTWAGTKADGSPEAEGKWRFNVTATDDEGRQSVADRLFSLNETLSALKLSTSALSLGQGTLRATFALAHPAKVTVTVETTSGIVVRTLLRGDLQPGDQSAVWNGRRDSGALAFSGRYVVHVSATNELGTADLAGSVTARR
jgi:flagellar hook assembly protein FlgD